MGEEITETGDFIVNEKEKIVNLTEQGVKKVETFFHIENLQIRRTLRSSTTLSSHSVHTTSCSAIRTMWSKG